MDGEIVVRALVPGSLGEEVRDLVRRGRGMRLAEDRDEREAVLVLDGADDRQERAGTARGGARLLLLLPHGRPDLLALAARLGVTALWAVGDPWRELLEGIRAAALGRPAFSSSLQRDYLPSLAGAPAAPSPSPACSGLLSHRELQVAVLVARGLSNREIGQRLYICLATVKSHVYRVLHTLGVESRQELRGLFPGPEPPAEG